MFVRTTISVTLLAMFLWPRDVAAEPPTKITVTTDRGRDIGQAFGSLFEATTADGSLTIGAGFQNSYNTRYRADRHSVEFFVRPTDGQRRFETETLPRPNSLCGTYLYGRDGVVRSTYGGMKAWNHEAREWQSEPSIGGTEETMRVGDGLLEFGDSMVRFDGERVVDPPATGSYQLFFYANGYLCFYHVNRGDGGYRPYTNDKDGFSKLYACPWKPGDGMVDLAKASVFTLPIVGETTFAWGQFGDQIITGSNIGGFYVFDSPEAAQPPSARASPASWRMLLAPQLGVSYQLYCTLAFRNRLLMGQYPTGRLFEFDGTDIAELAGWPPKLDGVSPSAREAQTIAIYGGDLYVGVWPWGELWRHSPDTKTWSFARRMFEHPEITDRITHPYDEENRGHSVGNLWGQRITSLVTSGSDLFVSTSAKFPCEWDAKTFPFLAPEKWKSYGSVYRLRTAGHVSAPTRWTDGPTQFEFTIRGNEMTITQDGDRLATSIVSGEFAQQLDALDELDLIRWGDGIYGKFRGSIAGQHE